MRSMAVVMSREPGSSGVSGSHVTGWGTVPIRYGMVMVLSWPLLQLRYDDSGARLRVRPRLLSLIVRGTSADIEIPWSEMSRFQYSGESVAWKDGDWQLCRFATFSAGLAGFAEMAHAHGVAVEWVRSTRSRAWTLD